MKYPLVCKRYDYFITSTKSHNLLGKIFFECWSFQWTFRIILYIQTTLHSDIFKLNHHRDLRRLEMTMDNTSSGLKIATN